RRRRTLLRDTHRKVLLPDRRHRATDFGEGLRRRQPQPGPLSRHPLQEVGGERRRARWPWPLFLLLHHHRLLQLLPGGAGLALRQDVGQRQRRKSRQGLQQLGRKFGVSHHLHQFDIVGGHSGGGGGRRLHHLTLLSDLVRVE